MPTVIGLKGSISVNINNIENNETMENKKTTELLDLLMKVSFDEKSNQHDIDDVFAELCKRPPFDKLFGENQYGSSNMREMTHDERLEELEDDVKLLKRHKHDDKSGDVLVRI